MKRPWMLGAVLACVCLGAQGPLDGPPELGEFSRRAAARSFTLRGKLEALVHDVFQPLDQGGLAMVYDNDHTRTVQEAWVEHRANCLTLTALYIEACRSVGLKAHFADVLNINRWHRSGTTIRFERHIVAMVKASGTEDLVADFLPTPRRRLGTYIVMPLSRERVLALFYSNRAVELLDSSGAEAALVQAKLSLNVDPRSSVGWNICGVVQSRLGQMEEAERSFRKALAMDAKDGAALGNLESLLRDLGHEEEAAKYRKLGQEVRMKDPYFRASLAEEALGERRLEDALKHAKASVKLQSRDPELLLVLARVRLALDDPEGAVQALEKAKRLAAPEERERFESKMSIIKEGKVGKGH